MLAKQQILDLWQRADSLGIIGTFYLVYGNPIGADRYDETVDAFSREDDVRIVKSMQQLWEDAPDAPSIHTWPAWNEVCGIAEHIFDEDYTSNRRVAQAKRDPNVNVYGEKVAPDDNIQEGGEPAPDVTLDELENDDGQG